MNNEKYIQKSYHNPTDFISPINGQQVPPHEVLVMMMNSAQTKQSLDSNNSISNFNFNKSVIRNLGFSEPK